MKPSERIVFDSVPQIQRSFDSRDAKGLSITTHLDSSVLWRPAPHAVPLKMSGRKYLHFSFVWIFKHQAPPFSFSVFYQQATQTKAEHCHLISLKQTEYNCSSSAQIQNTTGLFCLLLNLHQSSIYTLSQLCLHHTVS